MSTSSAVMAAKQQWAAEVDAMPMTNVPDCPFCDKRPAVEASASSALDLVTVYCVTEGCPAFSNVVSLAVWTKRRAHEARVMHIPVDEPIFILRGRDPLTIGPIAFWIEKAEKYEVKKDKVQGVAEIMKAFQSYQNNHPTKLPD